MKKSILSIVGILALVAGANAQVILINDTFTGGNITGWYAAGTNSTLNTSVSAFNAGGGNEYLSLNSANNTVSGGHAFRAFTGTTLAVGETLSLVVDVATQASQPNANNSVGFALFNTSSSYSANQAEASIWASGSQGYRFFLSTGSNTASTLGWTNLGATNTPWAGAGNVAGTTAANGTLAAPSTLTFNIARVGLAELQLTVLNGATTLYSAVSTAGATPDYFTFNTLAIGYLTTSTSNRNIRLDDVTLSVIPEPTTWALLAGGMAALVIYRRRRSA